MDAVEQYVLFNWIVNVVFVSSEVKQKIEGNQEYYKRALKGALDSWMRSCRSETIFMTIGPHGDISCFGHIVCKAPYDQVFREAAYKHSSKEGSEFCSLCSKVWCSGRTHGSTYGEQIPQRECAVFYI